MQLITQISIRRSRSLLLLLPAMLFLSGCLFRSRTVERKMSSAPLKSATQQDLITYIDTQAAKIQTLQATVDIDTSVGGVKKGKVTDYKEIRGYVLARKPAMLRMIGLLPIVRNRAFDMVSDGHDFKLWIPPKNRFVVGRNDVQNPNPQHPFENLRPSLIYDALLMRQVDPDREIAVMENDFEILTDTKGHQVQQPSYQIEIIRKGDHGWFLSRKIIFSRTDLLPRRQQIYDEAGNLATDSHYEKYQDYGDQKFPSLIEIWRPAEEYDITLALVKLDLNQPLGDDKFALEQPPGAELVNLDHPQESHAAASTGTAKR